MHLERTILLKKGVQGPGPLTGDFLQANDRAQVDLLLQLLLDAEEPSRRIKVILTAICKVRWTPERLIGRGRRARSQN